MRKVMKRLNQSLSVKRWDTFLLIFVFLVGITGGFLIGMTRPVEADLGKIVKTGYVYSGVGAGSSEIRAEDSEVGADDVYTNFTNAVITDNWRLNDNTLTAGTTCRADASNFARLKRSILAFDLSAANITTLTGATSVTIRLKLSGKTNTHPTATPTWSLFKVTMPLQDGYGGAIDSRDFDNINSTTRVTSEVAGYNEYNVGDWIDFPIYVDNWDDVLLISQNWAYVGLVESTYDWHDMTPGWSSDAVFEFEFYRHETYPGQLIVEYPANVQERKPTTRTNAATDNETTGYETADNITWDTPRAAYADEALNFIINGDSGEAIDLKLMDVSNNILASHIDSIRVDGKYYYSADVPDSTVGFVRLVETNNNIYSLWGYINPAVSSSQEPDYIYSASTDYPQYTKPFKTYVVQAGDVMTVHWQTRLTAAETDNASLRLWYVGDNTTIMYNELLSDMADDYYYNESDNDHMITWRYAVFTMDDTGQGFEDYDEMIIDLDRVYGWETSGFYQPVIFEDALNEEVTTTHSCYWYLADANNDGLRCSLDAGTYTAGNNMNIRFYAGDASKVKTELNFLRVLLINAAGTTIDQVDGVVTGEQTNLVLQAPMGNGTYTARFTLTKANKTFTYIKDVTFVVIGGIEEAEEPFIDNIVEGFEAWLDNWGLNNQAGHWLVLLVVMVLLFIIAYKSEILRVALPLVAMATAIGFGWIDVWVIILLALGAGLSLFALFRKKVQGGGEQ